MIVLLLAKPQARQVLRSISSLLAFYTVFRFNPSPDDDGQRPRPGVAASDDGAF